MLWGVDEIPRRANTVVPGWNTRGLLAHVTAALCLLLLSQLLYLWAPAARP